MKLLVAMVIFCLASACGTRQNNLYKNKRIIKVRVPPRQYPDFYNGPKGYLRPNGSPIRFKEYHSKHPEFYRPNHPPIYSNYNSYNNIYVKHQSRPPPQGIPGSGFPSAGTSFAAPAFGPSFKGFSKEIHDKFPPLLNYGSGYPHKGSHSGFKFPSIKDEVRSAHTQTFSAPIASVQTPSTVSSPLVSHSSSSSSSSALSSPSSSPSLSSSGGSSSYSNVQQATSYYVSTPHAHVQSFDDNKGPIREIPAPNLGPKPSDAFRGEEYATYGKGPSIDVTNLVTDSGAQQLSFPATQYYSAFGQPQHFELISDNALSNAAAYGSGYYKSNQFAILADGAAHGSTVSDVAIVSTSAPDVSYKSSQITVTPIPSPSTGYEVTEEQHTTSGASESDTGSSQFYYAPDSDPSLPVHKVPPSKEVFTDESLAETYVPQVSQNFQILEGGTVAAPLTRLSTQELYNLMHGFPRQIPVVAEPIVTIVGHQQPAGVYLQPSYQYAQTGVGNEQYSHAPQITAADNQYQRAESTQQNYVPQQQYTTTYAQTDQDVSNYNSAGSSSYEHEPEASESQKRGNVAKMDEESGNSVDSGEPQQENQIIIHFNKIPEVPFFTTLPNKKAAETLATLQAAGSIGSNYVGRIKSTQMETQGTIPENAAGVYLRGDQSPEEDLDSDLSNVDLPQQELESEQEQEDRNESSVEIQKSIPLYETSYAASSLLDDGNVDSSSSFSASSISSSSSQSPDSDVKAESYGKRIRPK